MKKIDLRKAARSRACTVRIPGVCNHNPETSVLAHYRLAGTCGTAIKPHDTIDGRTKTDYEHDSLLLMHAEGVFRTLAIWRDEEFI